jgi:integrase/recombinase XerD
MECKITLVLDTRRGKKKELYPVKLRVWDKLSRKAKLYSTGINLAEKEFESAWATKKTRKEFLQTKDELKTIEAKAETIARELKIFTFKEFERKMFRKVGDEDNILASYKKVIDRYEKLQQFGTKIMYNCALNSIKEFLKASTGKETTQRVSFFEVTPDWLQDYESYMINKMGNSPTTVSMYVRTLRTLYNSAIEDGDLPIDVYPFGKRKYQVPSHRNIKKALTIDDLRKLKDANPESQDQQKARDYFLLSFACNGMNMKDIVMLKWENMEDDSSGKKIVYYREKIKNTAKQDQRPTVVYISELADQIITRLANKDRGHDDYIFPILDKKVGEAINYIKVKNFTRFVNQHLKKLAKAIEITEDISTYFARHSFATIAIQSGASMEFVSEALSHRDMKTTQNYFAGFDEVSKRELMKKITTL